jgi:hypothetical protein
MQSNFANLEMPAAMCALGLTRIERLAAETAKNAAGEIFDYTSRQAEAEGLTTYGMGTAAQEFRAYPGLKDRRERRGLKGLRVIPVQKATQETLEQ